MDTKFDFTHYVTARKAGPTGVRGEGYAFEGDLKVLRAMRSARTVERLMARFVQLNKSVLAGQLLGSAVKVGPQQFPRIHRIVEECASTLGIAPPQVYLVGNHTINAMTLGTDDDSFIIVHSGAVEQFTDDELRFVIGHECGHVQNNHVVYLTTLNLLTRIATMAGGAILAPLLLPLQLALSSWSRAAEITCDRAGLLCCRDPRVATNSFLKLAIGSRKLFEELNTDAYLDQLREGRQGLGRVGEITASHPFLTKRVEAIRIFADSALYRSALGAVGGFDRAELERRTLELVKVL